MLNTPTAVLGVLVLVVAVNGFLFFGYYSERTASPRASSPPPVGRTQPETNVEEATTPVTEKPPEESPEESPATTATASP